MQGIRKNILEISRLCSLNIMNIQEVYIWCFELCHLSNLA